jgi:hypothetical protein
VNKPPKRHANFTAGTKAEAASSTNAAVVGRTASNHCHSTCYHCILCNTAACSWLKT